MAVVCSTGFRRMLLGPASFESIFNGGQIRVYSDLQPVNADAPATGVLLGTVTASGGLKFVRTDHYAANDPMQSWVLNGSGSGIAGWGRLVAAGADDGSSTTLPRIDFAIGLDDGSPGDFQMRLPSIAISPSTSIVVASWWFLLPPL